MKNLEVIESFRPARYGSKPSKGKKTNKNFLYVKKEYISKREVG